MSARIIKAKSIMLLTSTLTIAACTFGEGPELVVPASSNDVNDVMVAELDNDVAVQPQDVQPPVVQPPIVQPQDVQPPIVQPQDVQPPTVQPQVELTPTEPAPIVADPIEAPTPIVSPEPQPEQEPGPVSEPATGLVRIPRVDRANAPVMNGNVVNYIEGTDQLDGEWRNAAQVNDRGESLAIDNLMFETNGAFDEEEVHQWAAVHDGEYLYLLIIVDDAGNHSQDTDEPGKPWKDDSIELFFDGNNSRLEQYDGVDDFHLTVNLQSSPGINNVSDSADAKILQSPNSATLPSDISFIAGPQRGPFSSAVERGRKDIYEFRIRLSELNIQVDAPFGIELQINDDDNGGSRDRKWGWFHPAGSNAENDFTWQNPSVMGQAILLR